MSKRKGAFYHLRNCIFFVFKYCMTILIYSIISIYLIWYVIDSSYLGNNHTLYTETGRCVEYVSEKVFSFAKYEASYEKISLIVNNNEYVIGRIAQSCFYSDSFFASYNNTDLVIEYIVTSDGQRDVCSLYSADKKQCFIDINEYISYAKVTVLTIIALFVVFGIAIIWFCLYTFFNTFDELSYEWKLFLKQKHRKRKKSSR